jgi:hypothetical protein
MLGTCRQCEWRSRGSLAGRIKKDPDVGGLVDGAMFALGISWGAVVLSLAGGAETAELRGSRHDGVVPIRDDWVNTLSQPPAARWPTTASLGDIVPCKANWPHLARLRYIQREVMFSNHQQPPDGRLGKWYDPISVDVRNWH